MFAGQDQKQLNGSVKLALQPKVFDDETERRSNSDGYNSPNRK